ncbi:hypothetical protein ACFL6I_20790 [candidate division KSB1 bacterium]
MIDKDKIDKLLKYDCPWLHNGMIFTASGIAKIVEECEGKTLSFEKILGSVKGNRTHLNHLERRLIDGYVDREANSLIISSESEKYGSLRVEAKEQWHADYAIAKMILIIKGVETAFSLNGSGIDSISAQSKDSGTQIIRLPQYNLNELEVIDNDQCEGSSLRNIVSVLRLSKDSDRVFHLDLDYLFKASFPVKEKICTYRGGCVNEVQSLKSRCYDGSFKACKTYQNFC